MRRLAVCAILACLLLTLPARATPTYRTYINMTMRNLGPRGVVIGPGQAVQWHDQLIQAHPHWVITDLNWYKVEASPGVYIWPAAFDADYPVLLEAGAEIVVILKMAPAWARADTRPCGRIATQYIPAFAEFARRASLRYPRVNYWLVWNEADSQYGEEDYYGCWGDPAEPYFGGAYYASVINPVMTAIKSVNPGDQVYAGGFMMPSATGAQSNYLRGAILAGAQFDGVALHYYAWYSTGNTSPAAQVEKIRRYTKKPILLTETSMLYTGQGEPYETAQANYVHYIRGQVDQLGLQGFVWYALADTGWNHSGLMEGARLKPAFDAFASFDD